MYLFGVFRGTCLERQGIIFPLRIAEEGISAARMKYSIVHPADTTSHSIQWLGGIGEIIAPYGLILGLRCQTGQATGAPKARITVFASVTPLGVSVQKLVL